MTEQSAAFHSASPEDTAHLAERLGAALRGGDCILLSGGIGAGKSHFARSLILSRLAEPEDVPSPTFTLVQTYDLPETELWHADLYRLGDPDQVIELGLVDAFHNAICLVEWPDRLGDLEPAGALHVQIDDPAKDDTRVLRFRWTDDRWGPLVKSVVK